MKITYLDNAATTPLATAVKYKMIDYLDDYGNPSSSYQIGVNNREAIEYARTMVADLINAESTEIYFTSGGSESDNWVLKSVPVGGHIITSAIEHHAVLRACEWLEHNGREVTYLPVDEYGMVNTEDIEDAIKENTCLISVMFANNEIGTIQPVKEIGRIAHEHNILFHTDAVQAFGHEHIDVKEMNIDFLSCSAHKINGPKGVGALYMRDGVYISPLIHGGEQENGMRAGTENVVGIVGFGEAAYLAKGQIDKNNEYNRKICIKLMDMIGEIPNIDVKLNGLELGKGRLANNINLRIKGIRGEELATLLDMLGYCVSTGSACDTSNNEPSHVLKAIGLGDDEANSSIRITVSPDITDDDIRGFVNGMTFSLLQLIHR